MYILSSPCKDSIKASENDLSKTTRLVPHPLLEILHQTAGNEIHTPPSTHRICANPRRPISSPEDTRGVHWKMGRTHGSVQSKTRQSRTVQRLPEHIFPRASRTDPAGRRRCIRWHSIERRLDLEGRQSPTSLLQTFMNFYCSSPTGCTKPESHGGHEHV